MMSEGKKVDPAMFDSFEFKEAVFEKRSSKVLKQIAQKSGFKSFVHDSKLKIEAGLTTPEEIFRIISRHLL